MQALVKLLGLENAMNQRNVSLAFLIVGVSCFTIMSLGVVNRLIHWPGYAPTPPPPSIVNPPIYPGAQNVQSDRPQNEFGPRITFTTSDEPSKVTEYYQGLLSREGWMPSKRDEPSDWISFEYGHGPYYQFDIEVTRVSSNRTAITIFARTIPGID